MCKVDIKDTYAFLIRAAIPEVKEKKSRPISLERKSNLMWDSIYRAHRDVLVGRYFLENYTNYKTEGNTKRKEGGNYEINKITVDLYELLINHKSSNPRTIIELLYDTNREADIEFGAIQKLVNMTFKYLYILKLYKFTDESIKEITINFSECDCPLDSTILNLLGIDEKWTQGLNMSKYIKIQNQINEINGYRNKRLKFDFDNFQVIPNSVRDCNTSIM